MGHIQDYAEECVRRLLARLDDGAGHPRITAPVSLLEALGSEIMVHFRIDAPRLPRGHAALVGRDHRGNHPRDLGLQEAGQGVEGRRAVGVPGRSGTFEHGR